MRGGAGGGGGGGGGGPSIPETCVCPAVPDLWPAAAWGSFSPQSSPSPYNSSLPSNRCLCLHVTHPPSRSSSDTEQPIKSPKARRGGLTQNPEPEIRGAAKPIRRLLNANPLLQIFNKRPARAKLDYLPIASG
ncbi:unnamed protein product [Pleuronectes platessa]|uniref:Uncharacterized protein n=1 Tax=Pleuronectes platessa TaxID=8262 RepID=A0A9N7YSJ5_PLEPL|nr:unnamed protein product [Pleuronectes platessa]